MIKTRLFIASLSNVQKCNLMLALLMAKYPQKSREETLNHIRWHVKESDLNWELEKALEFGTEFGY